MLFEQIRVCSQQIEKVRIQRWYLPSAAESEELWQLFPHCLCSGTDIDKNLCLNVFCHPLHVKEASAQSDVQECFPWLTFWLKCLDSSFWSKITLLFCRLHLDLIIKTVSLIKMSTTVSLVSRNHFPAWESLPATINTISSCWLKYLSS